MSRGANSLCLVKRRSGTAQCLAIPPSLTLATDPSPVHQPMFPFPHLVPIMSRKHFGSALSVQRVEVQPSTSATKSAVKVNTTIDIEENAYIMSEVVKREIKKKLIEVIQARSNNIGNGNLYVAGPFNPIPGIEDFNECSEPEFNDCGEFSRYVNRLNKMINKIIN